MFDKYTDKARRVIFFARYEVSKFGAKSLDTEHLLLGLVREDHALISRFFPVHVSEEKIRKQIEEHSPRREKISTHIEVPLSDEAAKVLEYAAEESDQLSHGYIGTEHLLLGLLRKTNSLAERILREQGVDLSNVRKFAINKLNEREPSGNASA
jgi:ATP-dependent Clp protease ATP-binding subunit ClpC